MRFWGVQQRPSRKYLQGLLLLEDGPLEELLQESGLEVGRQDARLEDLRLCGGVLRGQAGCDSPPYLCKSVSTALHQRCGH